MNEQRFTGKHDREAEVDRLMARMLRWQERAIFGPLACCTSYDQDRLRALETRVQLSQLPWGSFGVRPQVEALNTVRQIYFGLWSVTAPLDVTWQEYAEARRHWRQYKEELR